MDKRENIQKELESLSPRLAERQGKGDGFLPPPGYFDALPGEVLSKLNQSPPAAGTPRRNPAVHRRTLAIAAAIALLVAAALWLIPATDTAQKPGMAAADFSQLSREELWTYVYENIDDFDWEMLVESGLAGEDAVLMPLPETMTEEEIKSMLERSGTGPDWENDELF
jgi:hypothetical protein